MIHYVLGFLFRGNGRDVLLIHKARGPSNVRGRLNGVGGKVNPGEPPFAAMRRESIEECGVDVSWTRYGSMGSAGLWECDLFFAEDDHAEPRTLDPTEPIDWCRADSPGGPFVSIVDNLRVLLAAAELARDGDKEVSFRLDYTGMDK